MKKVFGVVCHKVTNPLVYTVNYLSSFDENEVLIHVDANSKIEDFLFLSSKNVIFVKNRVKIKWGGYSQVAATIELLKTASANCFDYFFLISGDDLPCKTNKDINDFLNEIENKNIVHFDFRKSGMLEGESRVKYKYPKIFLNKNKSIYQKSLCKIFKIFKGIFLNKQYLLARRKGIVFYKGSNWISLNFKTVKDIVVFLNENKWYQEIYGSSLCCDEVFFHTLIKYLKFEDIYVNGDRSHDLRYIDWSSGPDFPRTLDASDVQKIKMRNDIFARKFRSDISYDVFAKLINND
ncbi:hypothetical protein L467_02812 [Klebsiella pneumoniae BIDMC 31]|uniref:beta-1,6-N-acetylglucosaminyltransferase n=1 Tax=Klebsiella TaxID=570 RepID=UPI0004521A19|nr:MULTISPECIES: beta-1,6-N-acetylglucosaminyltransferase [Klebsiella]ELS9208086.1 hypothetical protein [Klebsiella pneumoniae]ELT7801818.1 hypothetical protein [Klebsiella pneumoniae]ETX39999.1 hypothetical protein L467_02812 [Klebsiella pneumoniae BIDMC 31]MBL0817427.1 hypothetical protein [Klebsiella pneumoniae]MCQ8632108.1 beta-1,6-N-acetylglucosaminyltransferase [Klebsiella pneumoniae]